MIGRRERGRAFVLFGGFLTGTLTGGWLGLVAVFVSGIAASGPPRFSGEDFVAAVVTVGVLWAVSILVSTLVIDTTLKNLSRATRNREAAGLGVPRVVAERSVRARRNPTFVTKPLSMCYPAFTQRVHN